MASLGPDLKFASANVQVYVPSLGVFSPVAYGATFSVPCNTNGFRARYRYGNYGPVSAGAHVNQSQVVGSGAYSFAQSTLTAGTLRETFASFGAIVVPNSPTKLAIRLDSTFVVGESDESNNTWVAKVVRNCP